MVRFADDPEVRHRIAFLPNYDIAMAQPLYPGCDVWLNNPLRPYEACGTSGMKAALNGGLNLSILDGWWDEWYDGSNGWAIPSADGVEDPDRRDDLEANALYDLIENEVAPRFYDVGPDGVPARWLEMVRHTLKSLGPKVLATRMVRDYVRQLYTPGRGHRPAAQLRLRPAPPSSPRGRSGCGPAGTTSGSSTSRAAASATRPRSAPTLTVRAFVSLGELSPDDVDVQLVHGVINSEDQLVDAATESLRGGRVLPGRPAPLRRHRDARPQRRLRLHRARRPAPRARWPRPPSSASSRSRNADRALRGPSEPLTGHSLPRRRRCGAGSARRCLVTSLHNCPVESGLAEHDDGEAAEGEPLAGVDVGAVGQVGVGGEHDLAVLAPSRCRAAPRRPAPRRR